MAVCCVANQTFAATLQVDAVNGTDAATCGVSSGPGACKTINYAVNLRAAAGDTIAVAAATYAEQVSIPATLTGLTLSGAQAGVDARNRSAAGESILDGTVGALTTGIAVAANQVTIDGFTFQNYNAGGASFGYGIFQYGSTSGGKIINNILRGNGYTGVYMGCAGVSQCIAQFNLFDSNQAAGGGGDGIYNDTGTINVLIDSNKFINQINGSVIITGVASTIQNNITISNNVSVNDGLIGVFGATNVTISNNTATNPQAGIRVDGSQNVTVTGNAILGGASTTFYAFRASNNNGFPSPDDNITVTGNTFTASNYGVLVTNNFANPTDPTQALGVLANPASLKLSCNRIVGNVAGGLLNGDINTPVIPAAQNWWGCNAGPNTSGCDTANGANANNPWLILDLSATPNPLTLAASTELTASLNIDSSGATAPCSLPNITPIAFAGGNGAISAAATHTTNGDATATYTPASAGSSSVSATVDNQIVNLTVTTNPLSADLSVTMTGPASSTPGGSVVYNLTITNAGPNDAQSVSLTDVTPAGLSLVSVSGAGCAALPCSLGNITSAASITVAATYLVQSGATGNINNTAGVSSTTFDPNPANNAATVTTTITPVADLVATLTLPSTAISGAMVSGTFACTNNGPSTATFVSCAISGLPAGAMTFCVPSSMAAALDVGNSLNCTLTFTAPSAGSITATVIASDATSDPNPANSTVRSNLSITAAPPPTLPIGTPVLSSLALSILAGLLVLGAVTQRRQL